MLGNSVGDQTMLDSLQEKERASLARCLTRWVRPDGGGKIPGTEEGIAEHEALVEAYEDIYGPIAEGSAKQYAAIYSAIREGARAHREAERKARQLQEDYQAQEEEQAEEIALQAALRRSQRRIREARQDLALEEPKVPVYQSSIERMTGFCESDERRIKRLTALLPKYAASPGFKARIEKHIERAEERLLLHQARLDEFAMGLRECQDIIARAHAILREEIPAEAAEEVSPDHVRKVQQEIDDEEVEKAAEAAAPEADLPPKPKASSRRDRIIAAMRSYGGKFNRDGFPWLRPLREHAGMPNITDEERAELWPVAKGA